MRTLIRRRSAAHPAEHFVSLFLIAVATILCVVLFLQGCTLGRRKTATDAVTMVENVAESSLLCLPIRLVVSDPTSATNAANACGKVAADVADVAKLVESILASLPMPAGLLAKGMASPYAKIVFRGVTVTVPAMSASAVADRLAAQ